MTPEMPIAREEIFGPVLSIIRVKTLADAIELVTHSPFGNPPAIFTSSEKAAREYSSRCEVGMVGIGDLHAHGKDAVAFYTERQVIMSRSL